MKWFCNPAAFYYHSYRWFTGWYAGAAVFRTRLYLHCFTSILNIFMWIERRVCGACHSASIAAAGTRGILFCPSLNALPRCLKDFKWEWIKLLLSLSNTFCICSWSWREIGPYYTFNFSLSQTRTCFFWKKSQYSVNCSHQLTWKKFLDPFPPEKKKDKHDRNYTPLSIGTAGAFSSISLLLFSLKCKLH